MEGHQRDLREISVKALSLGHLGRQKMLTTNHDGSAMKRILIVDDGVAILKKMVELTGVILKDLNKESTEVLAVASGIEALGLIRCSEIHLLITDYSMPEINGVELIRELRDRSEMKKVLITFGPISRKDRTELAKDGVDEILLKPVDENQLKNILNRSL